MSTTNRRKLLLNTVSVSLGCSSCKKPKLSFLFHTKPKPKSKKPNNHKHYSPHNNSSSSSSCRSKTKSNYYMTDYDTASATTFSAHGPEDCSWDDYDDTDTDMDGKSSTSRTVRGFGRVGGQSVAVEKDSDDPYLDFRRSMLQMILEKEIYSKDDLNELLNCFLHLNSPYYHDIIVRAFTEIWNGVYSVKPGGGPSKQQPQPQLFQSRFGC